MQTIHKIHYYYLLKNFLFNTNKNIFDSIIKKTISSLNNSLANRSLFSSLFLLLNDIFMINNNFLSRLSAIMNAISRMLRMRTENNFFSTTELKPKIIIHIFSYPVFFSIKSQYLLILLVV